MTVTKRYLAAMFLIVVIASDVHTAEYADYDGGSSGLDGQSTRDFYDAVQQQSDDPNSAKLWNIPLQHLMVRKSQRSPSFRLRFGRRSDPLLANDFSEAFLNQDTGVDRKSVESPSYRLRFGHRSDPDQLSEDLMARKASRSPSLRLRFGRRSYPFQTEDISNSYLADNYLDKKMVRSPSYRLRFGRQSADASLIGPTEALSGKTSAEKESPTASEGDQDN